MIDLRPRSRPGPRAKRQRTTAIVVHHLAIGEPVFADALSFFLEDPEGVATVTLPGPYRDKIETIRGWRETGVPDARRAQAFVPYHYLVQPDGRVAQCLDIDDKGAHAVGANGKSIAICLLGDFRHEPPTPKAIDAVRLLLLHLTERYGNLSLWGHDDVERRQHRKPKGCPGRAVPLLELRAWLDAQTCWPATEGGRDAGASTTETPGAAIAWLAARR